jgi:hypothetical protein
VWTALVIVLVLVLALLVAVAGVRAWRKPTVLPEPTGAVEPAAGSAIEGVQPIPGVVERGPPLPVVLVHGLFGFDRIGVPGAYLRRLAGRNDGIVPVASQYWGYRGETLAEIEAEIEADHFSQIGWRVAMRGTFDALGLYAFVITRLGDMPHPQAEAVL